VDPLTTKDEGCNRNKDIKKGGRKEKKEETSKSGGDYRHLLLTREGRKEKTKKQKTIYRATRARVME
jgi:hypothetical protein